MDRVPRLLVVETAEGRRASDLASLGCGLWRCILSKLCKESSSTPSSSLSRCLRLRWLRKLRRKRGWWWLDGEWE
jgi:hypothetical protein